MMMTSLFLFALTRSKSKIAWEGCRTRTTGSPHRPDYLNHRFFLTIGNKSRTLLADMKLSCLYSVTSKYILNIEQLLKSSESANIHNIITHCLITHDTILTYWCQTHSTVNVMTVFPFTALPEYWSLFCVRQTEASINAALCLTHSLFRRTELRKLMRPRNLCNFYVNSANKIGLTLCEICACLHTCL